MNRKRWKARFFVNHEFNTNATPKEKYGFKTKQNCPRVTQSARKLRMRLIELKKHEIS